jgi:hypothetical protein
LYLDFLHPVDQNRSVQVWKGRVAAGDGEDGGHSPWVVLKRMFVEKGRSVLLSGLREVKAT